LTLVIDASALTELLLGRPQAVAVERLILEDDGDIHAPHLIDVEVVSALRRLVAAGDSSPERAAEAIDDLLDLPLERYPEHILLPRIWELRDNFSAYDASYVALAEALGDAVPLLTADHRLARATDAHTSVRALVP
jgi:predicted nucleic acid-binding protein